MTSSRQGDRRRRPAPIELAVSATCHLTFRNKGHVAAVRLAPLETTLEPASFRTKAQLLKDLKQALKQWIEREIEANVMLAEGQKQSPPER